MSSNVFEKPFWRGLCDLVIRTWLEGALRSRYGTAFQTRLSTGAFFRLASPVLTTGDFLLLKPVIQSVSSLSHDTSFQLL